MNIYDLACPVQMWALVFLQSSTHIDERFMAVLLDWLDRKVAILNLLQATDHLTATPQFLHSRMIDLVHENYILLLKVLNLEKNSNIRHLSDNFDVVSCLRPVEFLEDICQQLPSTCSESLLDLTISPERMETDVPEVVLHVPLALVPPSDDIETRWAICNELI
jgi:hypothetical protein